MTFVSLCLCGEETISSDWLASGANCVRVAWTMNLEDAGAAPNALPDNYFDLGLRLLEAGEYAEAIAMFERAIKLGLGDLAAVYLCRAEALSALGQWDAAEQSVNQALEIEPYLADAYHERGKIRLARREHEGAINDFTMAIHIEPEYDGGASESRAGLRSAAALRRCRGRL